MSIENMVSATVRRGERVQPRGVIPFYRKHLRARLFNSLLLSRGARFLYNFLLHTHTPISYSLLDYFSQNVICAYAVCPFVCDLLRANGCLCVCRALFQTRYVHWIAQCTPRSHHPMLMGRRECCFADDWFSDQFYFI